MRRSRAWITVVAAAGWALAGCAPRAPMRHLPPGGLAVDQVPVFVVVSSDDNGSAAGLDFLTALFDDRSNPAGSGRFRTFDGLPIHYSFYVNTMYIAPEHGASAYAEDDVADPEQVRLAWLRALAQGHEIGAHTHSHPHGRELSAAAWQQEITRCIEILGLPAERREAAAADAPLGVGIPRHRLLGFRTPFLELSDRTIEAVHRVGLAYDSSLEEGVAPAFEGRDLPWPYQLDRGSPGNPEIGSYPGLWEIPVYAYLVPPDEECAAFGVEPGLRDRLHHVQAYFDPEVGTITGMDWNLWVEFAMRPEEFKATIRYSLQQRLRGNRCPLTVGLHSAMYADRAAEPGLHASAEERREAVGELLDEMLQIPDLRVVSAEELLAWLKDPVALDG